MTWTAAMAEARFFAMTNPGHRYAVVGYLHTWRYGGPQWCYEVRCVR